MPSFLTKALAVTPISGINLDLSHPNVWLVRHVCSDKAEFSFLMYSLSQSLQGID